MKAYLFLPKINDTTINIVYIKKHTFVNIGDANDISGFSDYALERVLDIAEKKAIKAKEAMNSEISQRDEEFIRQSEITKGVGEFKI